jgi:hypothetical protein
MGGGTANTAGTVTSSVNFTSFSQFAIANATAAAALPVKFIAFNAQTVNEKVKLGWQVAEETNIAHYEVERAVGNNSLQQDCTGFIQWCQYLYCHG